MSLQSRRRDAVILLFALAGCVTDGDYLDQARVLVARGCCGAFAMDPCESCPLMQGATVTRGAVYRDCAGSCKRVEVETRGPGGAGQCTFMITNYNSEWHTDGACEPRTPARSPARSSASGAASGVN